MSQSRTMRQGVHGGNGRFRSLEPPAPPLPVTVPANSGIVPGHNAPVVRKAFTYLAGAYPSARVDEEYWAVLFIELAEVSDAALMQAVRDYIRTNDNAYRMPTVGELLRLSARAQSIIDQDERRNWDERRDEYVTNIQAGIAQVLRSVPQEDVEEVKRRMTAAYQAAATYMQAEMIIWTHLLDTADFEPPALYSPTTEVAAQFHMGQEAFNAQQVNEPRPEDPVATLTAAFPGKFRVRYPKNLAYLLDPDRV
jgi:hypothetical protein